MLENLLSTIGAYKLYEKWLWYQVKNGTRPEHIAIILDGNRRWASGKALEPWFGHEKGAEKVEQLLDWCLNLGVKSITLYAFSTENFFRSRSEIEEIMRISTEEFQKILTDEGYETFSALTGKQGLELFYKESPDVILLDLKLPDINGLEILKKIQSLNEDNFLTIIMTAHGSIENAVSAVKIGAYDFLEKPFSIDKLKLIIKNAFHTLDLKRSLSKVKEQELICQS